MGCGIKIVEVWRIYLFHTFLTFLLLMECRILMRLLCNISPLVTEEMNSMLESPFTDKEIKCVVF